MAKKQTAGRDNLDDLAPQFAQLNDDVLFGEVWSREEQLSPRDRSMITIAALAAKNFVQQISSQNSANFITLLSQIPGRVMTEANP